MSLRAEDYPVASALRADEGTGRVILRVSEGVATPRLEEPRQLRRAALAGVAAILRRFEHRAGVVAAAGRLQLVGALLDDVRGRALHRPGAAVSGGRHLHRHVVAVDDGDVVVVLPAEAVQPVLRLGVRRRPVRSAVELPAAVAGQAAAPARGVEGAVGAGPDLGHLRPV